MRIVDSSPPICSLHRSLHVHMHGECQSWPNPSSSRRLSASLTPVTGARSIPNLTARRLTTVRLISVKSVPSRAGATYALTGFLSCTCIPLRELRVHCILTRALSSARCRSSICIRNIFPRSTSAFTIGPQNVPPPDQAFR